uniref:Major facilitator superfamily (MFS) profile domain-containing protein n=1 Tax=Ciona savignyi TaxID=51511 RepID=H2YWL0_CIOSA
QGLFISIHGPTLLTLANNVGSTVGQVSWVFTGRSVGVLAGGIATGYVMRHTNNMLTFATSSLLLGAVVIATPWISALWLLVIVVMAGGVGFGFLDAGMQALVLQVWGEKDSRPIISGYHFAIALGAFLAPILAKRRWTVPNYTRFDYFTKQRFHPFTCATTKATITSWYSPVVWAYLICGAFMVLVGVIFVVLYFIRLEKRVRSTKSEVIETRKEDKIQEVALLFGLVCVYYFFCVAGETAYNSYIYSKFINFKLYIFTQTTEGTTINALFWAGFGSGRLAGVLILKYFIPKHVLFVDFIGIVVSMIIVCIFGEGTAEVTWAITFIYSFFQATIYPAGVSWTSQYTNMSGNYIFIFSAGQAVGSMVLLPVGGVIFDSDPFSVMYLILGCSCANAVVFGLMLWEASRLERKRKSKLET